MTSLRDHARLCRAAIVQEDDVIVESVFTDMLARFPLVSVLREVYALGQQTPDWSAMPPVAAEQALATAPKVAGPWVKLGDGPIEARWSNVSGLLSIAAWIGEDDRGFDELAELDAPYPDRASADAALRAKGWVLVDTTIERSVDRGDRGGWRGETP